MQPDLRTLPLPLPDASLDGLDATDQLQHFSEDQIGSVLAEWVRVLKPGARLTITLPHPEAVGRLGDMLFGAGLMLTETNGTHLHGTKPHRMLQRVSAVMSMPRLAFTANMFAVLNALPPLNIPVRTVSNPLWDQGIERGIEEAIALDNPDAVLTVDYDSVFTSEDVSRLIQLMCCHPEVDAVAAMQSHRGRGLPIFKRHPDKETNGPLTRAVTAHFGLTLLRTDKLKTLPKPWFHDVPAPDGTWGEGRTDADMAFWGKWNGAGNTLYVATNVAAGHLELMIVWPGNDHWKGVYQTSNDYHRNGKPADALG